ncbi:MAG: hypothetical protein P1V97_16930 [Planctomycetota bacterium]|nr:hypothetical protein [Planctomycetota bacterium]
MTTMKKLLIHFMICAQVIWPIVGCSRDSVSGKAPPGSGSLSAFISQLNVGLEVFKLSRQQVLNDADVNRRNAGLSVLDSRRDEFIDAINTILNDQTLPGVESTLDVFFKLIDDDSIPTLTNEMRSLILQLINEPGRPTIKALRDMLSGRSNIPTGDVVSLLGRLVNYPDSERLWESIGSLIAAYDGVDSNGVKNNEPPLVTDLLDILSRGLKNTPANPAPSTSLNLALNDFVDELLTEAQGTANAKFGQAEWGARLDDRGAPVVQFDAQGKMLSPFVDGNSDGLADLNPNGRFINNNGQEIDMPPFGQPLSLGYDAMGRASTSQGQNVYEFFDTKKTLLALFMSITGRLLKENRHKDIVDLLNVSLGPKSGDQFNRNNKLGRLSYGLVELVKTDQAPQFLRAMSELLNKNPAQSEELFLALARANENLKNAPSNGGGFNLAEQRSQDLVLGLLPGIDEVFESNGNSSSTARILIDTLASLDTQAPNWPAQFAPLFKYKTVVRESSPDGDRNDIDEAASTLVDRNAGLTTNNRSAVHQLLDLLKRADGCNFFGQTLAVFIVDTMAGLSPSTVGTLVSLINAVPGLANLFCSGISQDLISLDFLAKSGALDALLPIAKVFKDRNQTPLLVSLLLVIQKDYSTLLRPSEEALSSVLESGAVEELTGTLGIAKSSNDPVSGINIADILADSIANLVDDDQTVLDQQGNPVPSLAHLILNPAIDLAKDLDAAQKGSTLTDVTDSLFNAFLKRTTINGQEKLENQSLIPFLARSIAIVANRIPADAAVRRQDLGQFQSDLLDTLSSKDFCKTIEIVTVVVGSTQAQGIVDSIANLLTPNNNPNDDIFGAVLKLLSIVLQQPFDLNGTQPIAVFLGDVLDPNRALIPAALRTLEGFILLDKSGSILKVLRAALNPPPNGGEAPILTILDIFEELNQARGGNSFGTMTEQEIVDTLQSTADFMGDNQRGLLLFYRAIKGRRR